MTHPARDLVQERRAALRARAHAIGITDTAIHGLVQRFYAKIRAHAVLGPLFARSITDWPAHLARMERFWRSVLLNSGEYSGKPVRIHAEIAGIAPRHFPLWLRLFTETVEDISPGEAFTTEVTRRAQAMARSLMQGLPPAETD